MARRVALALLLFACSKRHESATTPVASLAPVEPEPVAIDAAPPIQRHAAAFAHFEKDSLFECIDVTLELPPGADAGAKPLAGMEKAFKKTTPIPEPCSAQFADRTALATCTLHKTGDGGAGFFEARSTFYDYADVGLTDRHMSDCMKDGGKWQAISRDSREWQKAKLEHDHKNLRKTLGKLANEE